VQGAQWGSEAKGAVAAALCVQRNIDIAVRTGAINAGHTVVYNGKRYAMQQLPTGWINPDTALVIGPGAYIHPDTLWHEVALVDQAMPDQKVRSRLFIDHRCGYHAPAAESASKVANRHHLIGATGKGCSEAIVSKIRDRNNGAMLFSESDQGKLWRSQGGRFIDTVKFLNNNIDSGMKVLIEGTQGTLLDLHLGPYPFTTSRMTTAANWIAEAGLAPGLKYETVLVARTYPIRVAGNSGPMDDEIEWVELARTINAKLLAAGRPPLVLESALIAFEMAMVSAADAATRSDRYRTPTHGDNRNYITQLSRWDDTTRQVYRVAASELHRDALMSLPPDTVTELRNLFEMTTVTKKLRRLAKLSLSDLRFSVMVNRPDWICITFMDYVEPTLANTNNTIAMDISAAVRATQYCRDIESATRVPVKAFTTGPNVEHMVGVDTRVLDAMEPSGR
jgi:adenylosuccinate synthase